MAFYSRTLTWLEIVAIGGFFSTKINQLINWSIDQYHCLYDEFDIFSHSQTHTRRIRILVRVQTFWEDRQESGLENGMSVHQPLIDVFFTISPQLEMLKSLDICKRPFKWFVWNMICILSTLFRCSPDITLMADQMINPPELANLFFSSVLPVKIEGKVHCCAKDNSQSK